LRIVTLNTWKNEGDYPRRLRLMSEGLADLAPDVVCLQEVFVGAGQDTAAVLARDLGLHLHVAPARLKLRAHDGRVVESSSGLAMLTRGVARTRTLGLPADPADGERIAQAADLVSCGRPIRLLNLHLTHLRAAEALRAAQLQTALAWAEDGLPGALVIAGDLNATAASPGLAPLDLPLLPATLHGAHVDAPAHAGLAIDHCGLIRPGGWRVARQGRGLDRPDPAGWFPSDHAAVVLDLEPTG